MITPGILNRLNGNEEPARKRNATRLPCISGFRLLTLPMNVVQGSNSGSITAHIAMNQQVPMPYGEAAREVGRCVATSVKLLVTRRLLWPTKHVGMRIRFADGTSARIYRETVLDGPQTRDPCVLVVAFRLRVVRGWGHALFRAESLLNTPLFVGFPGFVSKLWMANDQHGVYRGIYQWDGADRAQHYARSLWRVLAPVSVPNSIHYMVLPGLRRDEVLNAPHCIDDMYPDDTEAWWRVAEVS